MLKLRDCSREKRSAYSGKKLMQKSHCRRNFSSPKKGNSTKYFTFTTDSMQTIFYLTFMQIHTEKKEKGKFKIVMWWERVPRNIVYAMTISIVKAKKHRTTLSIRNAQRVEEKNFSNRFSECRVGSEKLKKIQWVLSLLLAISEPSSGIFAFLLSTILQKFFS